MNTNQLTPLTGQIMLENKRPQRPAIHSLAGWLGVLMLLASVMPALAAPSQSPLITRPDKRPLPNFMLTLDDSGSMSYQYLPERSFIVENGTVTETVSFPNDGKIYLHPLEIDARIFSFPKSGAPAKSDVHFVAADTSAAAADARIENQMQMRSPQVNSIYYNPEIKYKPWVDANGKNFTAADPRNAYLDPLALEDNSPLAATAQKVDLTDTTQFYDVNWYCSTDVGAPNYNPCAGSKKSYNPAIVYLLNPNQPPNSSLSYTLYNLNEASAKNYPKIYPQRAKDCALTGSATICSQAAELDNYANWFVFYRSRLLVAQGAIPAAFRDAGDSIRLGWGTIHAGSYKADADVLSNATEPIVQQGVRKLDAAHMSKFYNWLRSRATYAYTPSRSALIGVGTYFQRSDEQNPWSSNPGVITSTYNPSSDLTCRRSFNILATDGYYSSTEFDPFAAVGNVDNTTTANYTATAPFKDNDENTLSDIAMKYWATDLRAIANDVPIITNAKPYKGDPANWQHLNQYMIGFGVTGTLPTTEGQLDTLAACTSSDGCWKTPGQALNVIDDLWHAAVNSRGQYFSAKDAPSLTSAFQSALQLGSDATLNEAGLATAAPTLIGQNMKFVPEYMPIRWTGNIKAYKLNSTGKANAEPEWNAESKLPAPSLRNIFIWDAGLSTGTAVAFKPENFIKPGTPAASDASASTTKFSDVLIDKMGPQANANLVDYLRGNDPADDVPRRARQGKLPDFVNSIPLFVKGGFNLGYQNIGPTDTYKKYLEDKVKRTQGALLIGGNGGMLHAFSEEGVEQFAFIPYGGAANLFKLAKPNYGSEVNFHQFFVDGPLVESDAYLRGSWTNIVVGSMGAGGRSIFALKLDTEDPAKLNGSSVLWEVDGPSDAVATLTSKDDIGYITSEAQVGVLPNGKWKVFVGNGLDSQSGKAALLVIDLDSGEVESIVADAGTENGLGGVRLARNSTTKEVVAAYAGDAKGQLWRFEYDAQAEKMKVAYKGKPLFTALDGASTPQPQPISAAPVARPHPQGGRLVVFGTGRLFSDADSDTTQTQTLYGIWDEVKELETSDTYPSPPALSDGKSARAPSSLLAEQKIVKQTVVTQATPELGPDNQPLKDKDGKVIYQTNAFYDIQSSPIAWGLQKGWFMDLALPNGSTTPDRPRVIYAPQNFGQSVYITSLIPALNKESCATSIDSAGYAFLIKFLTGAQQVLPSFDTDGNGSINGSDISAGGMKVPAGPQTILTKEPPLDFETGAGGTTGCISGSAQRADGSTLIQDCENAKVRDRIWRQLLNPPTP